jgi:hypothetical protein
MNDFLAVAYMFIQIAGTCAITHYWHDVRKDRKTISILDIFIILLFPLVPLVMLVLFIGIIIFKICKPVLDIELFKLDK